MNLCAVIKYPPIQGGVSAQSYWLSRALARRGHRVSVVTNAGEVEDEYRLWLSPGDEHMLEHDFEGGGSVRVRYTGLHREHLTHIPYTNPFVTKLSALATEVVREQDCELLFSYYYEPYGISAQLASLWTGAPFVVQNAGSDRSRLMAHPELGTAYVEMLRRAALVATGGGGFEGLGVAPDRLAEAWRKTFLPAELFNSEAEPLDVDELVAELAEDEHPWMSNTRPLPEATPVIGVYGKVGDVKGSFDLVRALSRLRREGRDFALMAMLGGRDRDAFVRVVGDAGLADVTWFLPFLPHWRVPGFIRRCTCVAFLERRFPVKFHAPSLPEEIMACGGCAVLSAEVAVKQPFAADLRDGENVFVVDDPQDLDALARTLGRVLDDPSGARVVGRAAAALVSLPTIDEYGAFYERLLERAVELGAPATRSRRRHARQPLLDAALEVLAEQLPGTAHVLGGEFERLARAEARACLRRRGRHRALPHPRALALEMADAITASLEAEAAGPEGQFAAEISRYERDSLWLSVRTDLEHRERSAGHPSPVLMACREPAAFGRRRPVTDPQLRISEFVYDVEGAVEAAVAGNGFPDGLPDRRPTMLLWHKRANLIGRRYRINASTRRLLELCDGTRTVDELERLLQDEDPAGRRRLRPALEQLARAQVVALV